MIFQMMGISIQDIGSEFILQNTVLIGITTNCGQTSLTVTRMCKIHVHRFRSHSFYIIFFSYFQTTFKMKVAIVYMGRKVKKKLAAGTRIFTHF